MNTIFIILLAAILTISLTIYMSQAKPVSPEQRRLLQISVAAGIIVLVIIIVVAYLL